MDIWGAIGYLYLPMEPYTIHPQILKNFIVLEGIDGSGTTTQARRLSETFTEAGFTVFSEHEPTDQEIGREVRAVLQGKRSISRGGLAYLFAADRYEHLFHPEMGIIAKLQNTPKSVVICDRYFFSSLAYQSMDLPFEQVMRLNQDFPLPEYLFWLNLDEERAMNRITSRDRIQEIFEERDQQQFFRSQFSKIFEIYRQKSEMKIAEIPASLEENRVYELILESLNPMIDGQRER